MAQEQVLHPAAIRGTLFGVLAGLTLVGAVLHGDVRSSERAWEQASPAPVMAQVSTGHAKAPSNVLPPRLDWGQVQPSDDARRLAQWVIDSADNRSSPFVIVDKIDAQVLVFTSQGRLLGRAPALLGSARGDHSVPGIGERPIAQIRPEERTTPAGRFVSEPGRNHQGEAVIWVDYDAAVSMHRLRRSHPAERRAERLASPTPADNRISYGCINVPVDFFKQVVWPTLGAQHAVVYVMPDELTMEQVFPGLAKAPGAEAASA